MFELPLWIALIIGISSGGAGGPQSAQMQTSSDPVQTFSLSDDEDGLASTETDTKTARPPEPQIASGKFTTALEVKPILTATKASWVALRDYDGQDLLYFTQIESWRCGLFEIRYSVNGAAEKIWDMEPCYLDTRQPNVMKLEDHLPYIRLIGGSVETVKITLYYDDGTSDTATFSRNQILMP